MASRPCLFVTGTDTGVGKTTVSRALLASWRRRGVPVTPLKPIETGCGPTLYAADAAALARAAGTDPAAACVFRWELPVCPQAARHGEGRPAGPGGSPPNGVDEVAAITAAARRLPGQRLLVEGAGGLLVPIAPRVTMADLIAALGAQTLIVARSRLGTINHTLLTVAECRRRGLPVLGVVLNRTEEPVGPEEAGHATLIEEHGGVIVLGTLPYHSSAPGGRPHEDEDTALAALAEEHLDLDGLWQRWGAAVPARG